MTEDFKMLNAQYRLKQAVFQQFQVEVMQLEIRESI